MKLITRYNQYLFPALTILFTISSISSYFLIRKVLQDELDQGLTRTRVRIENYVTENKALPAINSFNDQKIMFERCSVPLSDSGLSSTVQFIPDTKNSHNFRQLVFGIHTNDQTYRAIISAPLEGIKHLTRLIVKIAVATIFLILLLLLIINRRLLSKIWRPFYTSLSVIKSFKVNTSGKLAFPATSIEEFNLMNNHFSRAAENAISEFKNLKEFSENASHEIQTPLAIMHSKIDLLVQQENLTEKQSELLRSLYAAVNKLSKIQQSLLLLTKIDNSQFGQNNEIALHEEVTGKIEQFHDIWQSNGIEYTVQIQKTIISSNKELVEILLNNLFSNATRYNIPNGSVNIKLENGIFEINNTGPNEPLDQSRIFKRFYKFPPNSESNGLGLSIIKEICNTYSIDISYYFKAPRHIFRLSW